MNVKLMKGLQECIRGHECQKRPYFLTNDCRATLLTDAEELLGDAPTRLMTKEEVLSQPEGAVVWRECHLSNGQYELRPMVCDGKGCCGEFGLSVECKYDFGRRYYVRYWTNKPTDEQRKAAEWND